MAETGGIAVLGIDWKIFIAQLVNFVIVFWLLNRFAFKPLLKVLEERRTKVEKSVKDAQEIIQNKERLDKEVDKKLKEASQKAQEIITSSNKAAKQEHARIRGEADASSAKLIKETKAQIADMKQSMKSELAQELGTLIVTTTEKVIGEEVTPQVKNKIDKDMAREVARER